MSEFKYACPYCGQHIKCDSSQNGLAMECPTCFQKIIPPEAPADAEQKFILSGKKISDRPKVPLPAGAEPALPSPGRSFPVAALALMVLIAFSVAAGIVFRDKLFKPGSPAPVAGAAAEGTNSSAGANVPPVVIPHASDTNWALNLEAAAFPEAPVAGRIHGQDFLCEKAYLQNGVLTLRMGNKGTVEFGLVINFNAVQPEALAGKSINITTNAPVAAKVTLRWKETEQALKDSFESGYALRLEFGPLDKNHLSGKIYFCAPDDSKSYLAGNFSAEVRKPKVAKPKP